MSFLSRHEQPIPSWQDFERKTSLAFESKLRSGTFDAALPASLAFVRTDAPVDVARGAAPRGIAGPGGIAGKKRITVRKVLRWLGLAVIYVHLAWIMATSVLIIAYRWVDPSATVLMAYRKWGYHWKLEAPRQIALRKVPAYLRSMLVAVEDDTFYEHHGISMKAFKRAHEINERLGKPLYGGSTLTMQVSRTLFLVPVKSYVRKYFEVIAALELELFLPKQRILELYFGYAEWGKGVFGIEAASRRYYGSPVSKLSREQGARLIALLSSPIKYSPSTLQKSLILRERYGYLVRRYVSGGAAGASPGAASAAASAPRPPATPEPGQEEAVDGTAAGSSAEAAPASNESAPSRPASNPNNATPAN
jgi:monofunctional biosynthetic peptidoglycan transglycosylase